MSSKQVLIALTAVWVTGAVWAQQNNADRPAPAPAPQGEQPGRRAGPDGGGGPGGPGGRGGMMGAFWQLRQFDTSGDILVDEKELNAGLDKIKTRSDEASAIILKEFDANGDKKITGEEEQKLRDFMTALMGMQQFDRNRDWQVDEDEMKQAFDQLADAAQRLNDGMLQRFDKDGDGKLSAEEAKTAKAEMQPQWPPGGPRRDGGGAPRPGGERAPGQQPPAPQPAPAPAAEQKPNP